MSFPLDEFLLIELGGISQAQETDDQPEETQIPKGRLQIAWANRGGGSGPPCRGKGGEQFTSPLAGELPVLKEVRLHWRVRTDANISCAAPPLATGVP